MRAYLQRRGLWDEDAEREAASGALQRIEAAMAQAEARPIPTLEAYIEAATGQARRSPG
jgi:TPP-dependent pyruvate/acetoin dehydrogenase alpha subunit